MKLAALIQKGGLSEVANANPAKAANDGPTEVGILARLATLALAKGNDAANDSADPLPDPKAEARRARVLALLEAHPTARYALVTDEGADPEVVILVLAIRGQATCELRVPRAKWDGVLFLDLLERHAGTLH